MTIRKRKTFILGLGNQKCGTSWLYEYLKQSPHFHGGFAKEYHIWDALDIQILKCNQVHLSLFKRLIHKEEANRYRMQKSKGFYFDYFNSLYSKTVNITADITPSYSGLTSSRLKFIKEQFKKRNITVKPIIFIRDPLSRIKSAVRYNLDRKNYSEGIDYGETNFQKALEQYFPSEHCRLRTNYDQIIQSAFKVFGKNGVYVGIYENMFSPAEVKRLSDYLGVKAIIDFADVKVNKTKGIVEKTKFDSEIKEFYSDIYEFCFKHFPSTQKLW